MFRGALLAQALLVLKAWQPEQSVAETIKGFKAPKKCSTAASKAGSVFSWRRMPENVRDCLKKSFHYIECQGFLFFLAIMFINLLQFLLCAHFQEA